MAQAINNKGQQSPEQDKRICMAVSRIFASATMGAGALIAISALPFVAAAPISAVLTIAIGVGAYAQGHDVFILAKRFEELENPFDTIENAIRGTLRNINNLFTHNPMRNAQVEQLTAGTFFQPMWVRFFGQQA